MLREPIYPTAAGGSVASANGAQTDLTLISANTSVITGLNGVEPMGFILPSGGGLSMFSPSTEPNPINVPEIQVGGGAGPINGFAYGDIATGQFGDPGNYTGYGAQTTGNILASSAGGHSGPAGTVSADERSGNFAAADTVEKNQASDLVNQTASGGNIEQGWKDIGQIGSACAAAGMAASGGGGLAAVAAKEGFTYAAFQGVAAVASGMVCAADIAQITGQGLNPDESAALNWLGQSVVQAANLYAQTGGGSAVPAGVAKMLRSQVLSQEKSLIASGADPLTGGQLTGPDAAHFAALGIR